MNTHTKNNHVSHYVNQLAEFHNNMYRQALQTGDRQGLSEAAGILCVACAMQGKSALSRKWAEEFFGLLTEKTDGAPPLSFS